MAKDNPDILHEMDQSCSFSYSRTTINFCIALGRQLWKDFRILNGTVHIHVCMHICVRTIQSFKCLPCSYCLPNQVRLLDHYSLTIGEPSTSRARHAFPSLFEILDTNVTCVSSRESMAYFPLANARASEITFQHRTVQFNARYSYISIQWVRSVVMPKSIEGWRSCKRKEKYAVLSYQFVSGVFGISDKFEARSLKILFSVRMERA